MASKKPDLDENTVGIARRMLSTPPKPHGEMKIGKATKKPRRFQPSRKRRVRSS
jgi:hypothetical protein